MEQEVENELTVKLTEWENEPSIRDLKTDLEQSRSDHSAHITEVDNWLDNLSGSNAHLSKLPKNRSKVVPKVIRKQAEWRYASLSEPFLSTDDIFNIEPITSEDKQAAYQNALVLNNQLNTKINKVEFIDEYVRTAVDEGTVIVRVGWDYEEEVQEVEVPQVVLLPDGSQKVIGSYLEERTVVLKNQPTIEVCDYTNVIIDPTCKGNLDKAGFVIYSFETSHSELKKDGRYKNLDQIQLEDHTPLSEPDHVTDTAVTFNYKDNPRKKIVAYEYWGYWDIHNTGIVEPIVATFVGNTLIRLEENPFPDKKLPFVIAQYLPRRKEIYGEPDGYLLEDNQKVIGAVTRGMIDIMGRSANAQMGYRKDALDVTNQRKFERGEDYSFNANVDPRQAFHMGTYPEIPRSAMEMINLQNADAESLTGVKAFSGGLSGSALGSTATGIRSALDATSKRELGILRRLAKGIEQIGRKIISMNAVFLEEVEVVRITNEQFVPVRRDDLAGNFDLRLSISTAEADNEKAQELSFMLQTMGNNMDPEMSKMILADIAKLRKMPSLAKRIEEYQPQPDPMAVQKAQLELALLQAQIQNEQNKALENGADIKLKQAKTQNELAKAGKTQSEGDLKDLEFLEKEAGEDHAKDMEKKQFDRDMQLDMKAADQLFGSPKA
jgi:hypothetical protein